MLLPWAEAAPQIAIALGIIAAVGGLLLLVFRQLTALVGLLTQRNGSGKPESRLAKIETKVGEVEAKVDDHNKRLVSNDAAHRKLFRLQSATNRSVGDIMEHLTGSPSTAHEYPLEIDDMDTGEFHLPDGGAAE